MGQELVFLKFSQSESWTQYLFFSTQKEANMTQNSENGTLVIKYLNWRPDQGKSKLNPPYCSPSSAYTDQLYISTIYVISSITYFPSSVMSLASFPALFPFSILEIRTMHHYREPAFSLVLIELYYKHMVHWAKERTDTLECAQELFSSISCLWQKTI